MFKIAPSCESSKDLFTFVFISHPHIYVCGCKDQPWSNGFSVRKIVPSKSMMMRQFWSAMCVACSFTYNALPSARTRMMIWLLQTDRSPGSVQIVTTQISQILPSCRQSRRTFLRTVLVFWQMKKMKPDSFRKLRLPRLLNIGPCQPKYITLRCEM